MASSLIPNASRCSLTTGNEPKSEFIGKIHGNFRIPTGKPSGIRTNDKARHLVLAMGTKIVTSGTTKGGDSQKSKPKFGTVFFKPKDEDDDEESSKGSPLAITPKSFTGLQFLSRGRKADDNTVFVANADGKTGARIVLELLHDGFKVRAGVQDLQTAQQLAKFASEYGIIDAQETKRLNVVEFSPDEIELIAKAIGNASKVVVSIGEGEQGPGDKVTPAEASQIVEAAALAKVANLILVAQLGGSAVISDGPAGFFAKLFAFFTGKTGRSTISYTDLVDKIVDTDIKYTIFQTSDTASVPDTYASTSAVVIGSEGSSLIGKISKLQVASVVSTALSNISLVENKVYEVSASPEATATPVIDLLSVVEEDNRRQLLAEERAKEAAEEEARKAAEEAMEALQVAARLEEEAKKLAAEELKAAALAQDARLRAEKVSASVEKLTSDLKAVGGDFSRLSTFKFKAPSEASGEEEEEKKPSLGFNFPSFSNQEIPNISEFTDKINPEEIKKRLSFKLPSPPKSSAPKSVAESTTPPPASPKLTPKAPKAAPAPPAPKAAASKKKSLFAQETFYVDDADAGDF